MVLAAATAEACTNAGSVVGTAFAPHALKSSTTTALMVNIDFDFMEFTLPFSFANGCKVFMYRNDNFVGEFRAKVLSL
jgi:hypothetical protein